jgi:hypothetical protein
MCDSIEGANSYFYDQQLKICKCYSTTLEENLKRSDKFGAPKKCSGRFRPCVRSFADNYFILNQEEMIIPILLFLHFPIFSC